MANHKPPSDKELKQMIRDTDARLRNLKAEQARRAGIVLTVNRGRKPK